jgi:PTH1 family peptidyl-tRNA hydrolase
MYLIVGLGNPGRQYKQTRHNVGFGAIERLSKDLGVRLKSRRFQSRSTRTTFEGHDIILIRPMTYMNRSGSAVHACMDFYGLHPGDILVIHDDIDLQVGRVKVVKQGGAGGHKGVSSLIEHLGTHTFARVKIGIGRPRHDETIEDFVLSPFYQEEKPIIEEAIQTAVEAFGLFVAGGIESTMNVINSQNLANKEVKG